MPNIICLNYRGSNLPDIKMNCKQETVMTSLMTGFYLCEAFPSLEITLDSFLYLMCIKMYLYMSFVNFDLTMISMPSLDDDMVQLLVTFGHGD